MRKFFKILSLTKSNGLRKKKIASILNLNLNLNLIVNLKFNLNLNSFLNRNSMRCRETRRYGTERLHFYFPLILSILVVYSSKLKLKELR